MKTFPMFLKMEGRRVIVIGGGEQAAQKVRLVLKTSAELIVVTVEPDAEITAFRAQGQLTIVADPLTPGLFDNVALVFIATGCRGADAAFRELVRERNAVVNVVDAPDLCDAFTPSIVDRDPVVVAIGTEGTAPILARGLKTRIEEMIEPRLGDLAALAGRLRSRAALRFDPQARRELWRWVFNGRPRKLHAAGRERDASKLVKQAIETGSPPNGEGGYVSLVGAGPGSRDLITLRGVQRLQEADIIFHDRLVDPDLLELARRDAERVFVGKMPGAVSCPQERINRLLIEAARQGRKVVRLKCGDPGIFGRGAEEAESLDAAGIAWEVVPGVTAAAAAVATASSFLTERGRTDTVVMSTGQLRAGDGVPSWADYLHPGTTLALYMAVGAAETVEADLLSGGAEPGLPVQIISRASMPDQKVVKTELRNLARSVRQFRIENPAMILVRRDKSLADGVGEDSSTVGACIAEPLRIAV